MEFDADNWKAIFEQSPIGIAIINEEGKWIKVNDVLSGILGFSASELEGGMTFGDITHPSDIEACIEMTKKAAKGDLDSFEMVKRYISKGGKLVWVRSVVHVVRGGDGNFNHFVIHLIPFLAGDKDSPDHLETSLLTIKSFNIKDFFRENWKWVLTVMAASAVALFNFFSDIESRKDRIEDLEKDLKEIRAQNAKV